MTEIRLKLTATPSELLAVSTALLDRATWTERRVILLAIPLPMALASGLGLAWLRGIPLSSAALVAVYTLLGGLIGMIFASRLQARRYRTLFSASSLRSRAVPVTLSGDGLQLEARQLPWAEVSGSSRWRGATLLHFSAVDALVIPDRDLPPDMTPDALQQRVAAWKQS